MFEPEVFRSSTQGGVSDLKETLFIRAAKLVKKFGKATRIRGIECVLMITFKTIVCRGVVVVFYAVSSATNGLARRLI